MTPEERSEALIESIQDGDQDQLVESWLAEKDADIAGLRSLVEVYEHKFVAKNAEIERLRGGRFVSYETARDMAEDVRADERRRTAELIITRLEENERWLNDEIVTDDGFAQQVGRSVLADMRSLAREIGGGDE